MVASLFMAVEQEILPLKVNDTATAGLLLQLFPEIKNHYGADVETELFLDMSVQSGDFLTVSRYTGIEIGKNDIARAKLIVKCKNATVPQEVAVQFDMDLQTVLNVTVDPKWKFWLNVPTVQIQNVKLSLDHVGMISRRYDALMSTVVRSLVNTINVQWQKPFDITSLNPQSLPFLSNMFTNLHVSPYYQEEFVYVGFSYFVDPTPQSMVSFNRITDLYSELYKEKFYHLFDEIKAYFKRINKKGHHNQALVQ
jgi:hypothetical protein